MRIISMSHTAAKLSPCVRVELPAPYFDLFKPARYKIYYGGRGGAKSWGFARVLVALAYTRPLHILCCREFQNSIAQSSHKLISEQIALMGLSAAFRVTEKNIRTIHTAHSGSVFTFKGLAHHAPSIKSMEGVDIVWVEEAQTISRPSLDLLIPTIRKEGSELWFSYNPEQPHDPIEHLRKRVQAAPGGVVKKVGWQDNPWFPKVLEAER